MTMAPGGLPLHPVTSTIFIICPRLTGLLHELFHILSLHDGLLCIISLCYLPSLYHSR